MVSEQNIDYDHLSKIEKLAYLFVALGPETSAPLLKQLDDEIIEQVCRDMANIHVVPNDLKKRLVKEFALLVANKMGDTLLQLCIYFLTYLYYNSTTHPYLGKL